MPYYYILDLHGQTVDSAGKILTRTLNSLPHDVREMEVIHGFHQGDALKKFVRNYKNKRIEKKIVGLNQGSTIFIIRKQ